MPSHAQIALRLLNYLRAAGLPVRSSVIFTSRTDPELAGASRAGPREKVVFADSRINRAAVRDHRYGNPEFGGQVEVYADPTAAVGQVSAGPDGFRVLLRGRILLRLSPHFTRVQVAEYAEAMTGAANGSPRRRGATSSLPAPRTGAAVPGAARRIQGFLAVSG